MFTGRLHVRPARGPPADNGPKLVMTSLTQVPLVSCLFAVTLAVVAAILDGRRGVIPNWLTYGGALVALLLAVQQGYVGAGLAGLGMAVAVTLPLYALKSLGGGDVKLLCALGIVVGVPVTIDVLIYSAIAGAALSIFLLIAKGKLWRLLRDTCKFFHAMLVPGKTAPVPVVAERLVFGPPIALGTIVALLPSLVEAASNSHVDGGYLDFILVALRSDTFWTGALLPATLCTIAAVAIGWWVKRKTHVLRQLHADRRGAAAAVDIVLTTPIVFAIVLPLIQFAMVAHGSVVVHYAAYQAARSARVWYWDRDTAFVGALGEWADSLVNNVVVQTILSDKTEALERVDFAARYALIPIAPASHPGVSQSVPDLDQSARSLLNHLAGIPEDDIVARGQRVSIRTVGRFTLGEDARRATLVRKALYAFDDRNTVVTVDPVRPELPDLSDPNVTDITVSIDENLATLQESFSSGNAWRVKADVRFRYYLPLVYANRLFGARQPEGFYARWLQAEIVLL